jgi:ABC-type proline/glycine betaine transport system permease subunit
LGEGLSAAKNHWNLFVSDLRHGARALAAAPGLTLIALLVTALGIGATTAIFSVVDAVLLRSLPYGRPDKLMYLWSPNTRFQGAP